MTFWQAWEAAQHGQAVVRVGVRVEKWTDDPIAYLTKNVKSIPLEDMLAAEDWAVE